jgi:hypothetical protein
LPDLRHSIVIFMVYTLHNECPIWSIVMSVTATSPNNSLVPLQLFASRYGHAALLDADGNELPITENMIRSACEEAMDALYSFVPPKRTLQQQEYPA